LSSHEEILVVAPQAPWPARRDGYAVRYYPLLEYLSQRHQVDLCLIAEFDPKTVEQGAKTLCRSLFMLDATSQPTSMAERWLTRASILNIPSVPYHIRKFASERIAAAVLDIAARRPYCVIVWVSSEYMEAAAIVRRRHRSSRFVLDLIDSPALYYRRQSLQRGVPWLVRTVAAWQTRRYERRWRSLADRIIYISEQDVAESHGEFAKDGPTTVIPNGLLADEPAGLQPALPGPPALGFLGHMGYEPNINAVQLLHDQIFRRLQDRYPQLRLIVIGRAPAPQIRELASDHVIVTGGVETIWPYVKSVDVFVFPMLMGAGLQNKILEALVAGRPVVTTSICARPLGPEARQYLTIADTAEEFVMAIDRLLQQPSRAQDVAQKASHWVRAKFDWGNILPRYERTILARDTPNQELGEYSRDT
jgi:polysaccharide biosynthesis protein PslH